MRLALKFDGTQYEVMETAAALLSGLSGGVRAIAAGADDGLEGSPLASKPITTASGRPVAHQDADGVVWWTIDEDLFSAMAGVLDEARKAPSPQASIEPLSLYSYASLTPQAVREWGTRLREAVDTMTTTAAADSRKLKELAEANTRLSAEVAELRAAAADVADLRKLLEEAGVTRGIPLTMQVAEYARAENPELTDSAALQEAHDLAEGEAQARMAAFVGDVAEALKLPRDAPRAKLLEEIGRLMAVASIGTLAGGTRP